MEAAGVGGRCRDGGKWAVSSSTMLGSEQKKLRKKIKKFLKEKILRKKIFKKMYEEKVKMS